MISQAISDATLQAVAGSGRGTTAAALERARAIDWLLKPNRDFEEVCGLADVDPDQVRRLARQKIEEAQAGERRQVQGVRINITHNGETLAIKQWARRLGLSPATIRTRLDNGATPEEALRPAQAGSTAKLYTLNGESLSLNEWAKRTGIAAATINYRLRSGWPLEDALTQPVLYRHKPKAASQITFTGGGRELSAERGDRRGEARATFSPIRTFA